MVDGHQCHDPPRFFCRSSHLAEQFEVVQGTLLLRDLREKHRWGQILWMEEILHQLVDGLSHCNPIIYSIL